MAAFNQSTIFDSKPVKIRHKRFKCKDGIHTCPVAFLNSSGECMFIKRCSDYNKPAKPNKYGRRYF